MRKTIQILLLGILVNTPFIAEPVITIASDLWGPYALEAESDIQGFTVEIVREIFEPLGYTVVYLNRPWTRALAEVEAGTIDGALGATPEEFPGGIYPAEELGLIRNAFFVRSDSSWTYEGLSSLSGHIIAGVQDYNYGILTPHFERHGKTGEALLLKGEKPLDSMIQMLISGRIDIFVEDQNVALFKIIQMNLQDRIRMAGPVDEGIKMYIVLSPVKSSSRKYSAIFSREIQAMREDGRIQHILKRYGLEDWK